MLALKTEMSNLTSSITGLVDQLLLEFDQAVELENSSTFLSQ